ncbi:hypothetical protein BDN70DRAFT_398511 [Pholiota conissans]|uniref:Protein kinase domain-containing protein n=1 Tax=Pholiota conissans TaxID=109636 RepID=A0A9P6CV65_9AGAR|nr:hypothetical protein BDN70DRAFT_398511 [Pholiota conissans]
MGITHRDLKPETTRLSSKSPTLVFLERPWFCIFQSMCGTAHYVADEIIGDAPYDDRVDSHSVGVIIHVMYVDLPIQLAPVYNINESTC